MEKGLQLKYKAWNELPIGQYEKIKEIIRSESEDMDVEILAVLCGVDVDTILNMPVSEVWKMKAQMGWLFTPLNVRDRLKYKYIKLDGVKYVVHTDFKDITTAQYIDFQTFYQDYEQNYCNVLACFIIPEGHKYNDGYDALETAEIFREKLSVEAAENACFFFAQRSKDSFLRGLRRLTWTTTLKEAKTKNLEIRKMWTKTREELMKQSDVIDGLGKSMRSPIPSV